ncbi:hypothetical protein FB451DRAFT_1422838 [Mycena latifolia]|nr:hypothetical protein FB451DRAFT_1422838 [Mycena latifolia]
MDQMTPTGATASQDQLSPGWASSDFPALPAHRNTGQLEQRFTVPAPPLVFPTYLHYDDSGDEGYISDTNSDVPPPLLESEAYEATLVKTTTMRFLCIPFYSMTIAQDRRGAAAGDEPGEDDKNIHSHLLHLKEPPGGACLPCCRCYCNCALCRVRDAEPIEAMWATRRRIETHLDKVITQKGICCLMGPCLLESHAWYIPPVGSPGSAEYREVRQHEEACLEALMKIAGHRRVVDQLVHNRKWQIMDPSEGAQSNERLRLHYEQIKASRVQYHTRGLRELNARGDMVSSFPNTKAMGPGARQDTLC